MNFDRGEDKQLSLTKEAAHSRNRIIHTGDATGKEVCDTLVAAVRGLNNVHHPGAHLCGRCTHRGGRMPRGAWPWTVTTRCASMRQPFVICASGGYGRLYASTTNPEVATGDGAAMAFRAGAKLMDLEFVQFHPTSLFRQEERNFLISEAVRGEGAVLRNLAGERFMPGYHELAELAPRDVVSRAIFAEMKRTGAEHMWLDITCKDRAWLERRFPTIFAKCLTYGIDISKDYIPVAPSQHYSMGGIRTDDIGHTTLPGLYAVGEAACKRYPWRKPSGIEFLLAGAGVWQTDCPEHQCRFEQASPEARAKPPITLGRVVCQTERRPSALNPAVEAARLQARMTLDVGIIRNADSLLRATGEIAEMLSGQFGMQCRTIEQMEVRNMTQLAALVTASATARTESRGAHYRDDYPQPSDDWMLNLVI